MSKLEKEVMDNVIEIRNTISNKDEAAKVMDNINNIIDAFSKQLLNVSKRQTKLEEKTEEIFEMLSNIEEELISGMSGDFAAECPYCGEDVSEAIPEDGSDFKCPKCNNVIELQMLFDGCDCGCEGCHGDCEDCDCDDCDCEDDNEEE